MLLKNIKRKTWIQFLSAVALCGILLSAVLGSAYARYENTTSQSITMKYEDERGHIYIRNVETAKTETEWNGLFTTEFVLANGTDEEDYLPYDQAASLSIVATVGLGNPVECVLTLVDGTVSYQASYEEVLAGTKLYSEYGPGWVYHFYDENGKEIEWQFSGKKYMERQMKVVVNGVSQAPAALNLIVDTKPVE